MQRVVPAVRAAATAAASNVRCMSTAFPSYLLNAPATEISTLNNGVRVASEVNPRLVLLWIASLHAALTRFVAFVLFPLLAATGWPRRDCHGWCLYRCWQQVRDCQEQWHRALSRARDLQGMCRCLNGYQTLLYTCLVCV